MDPKCKCGKKIDSKRDINVEEIRGGVGDKGYKVAVVYCSHCSNILGAFPSREMFQDMIREEIEKKK